jgi:hypothetical protein
LYSSFLLWIILLLQLSGRSQYYLANINIIDVENGCVSTGQSVLIDGNLIRSISSAPIRNVGYTVYDCAGKCLIPGLWNDNPLNDIGNTQKINAVIVNGKYLSKADLKEMLDRQRKR